MHKPAVAIAAGIALSSVAQIISSPYLSLPWAKRRRGPHMQPPRADARMRKPPRWHGPDRLRIASYEVVGIRFGYPSAMTAPAHK